MFDDLFDIASQLVMKWARRPDEKILVSDDYTVCLSISPFPEPLHAHETDRMPETCSRLNRSVSTRRTTINVAHC